MKDRSSKLAFLHKVKERKTPSLSAQASFALFSLKVAWSGKSLIDRMRKHLLGLNEKLRGSIRAVDANQQVLVHQSAKVIYLYYLCR